MLETSTGARIGLVLPQRHRVLSLETDNYLVGISLYNFHADIWG